MNYKRICIPICLTLALSACTQEAAPTISTLTDLRDDSVSLIALGNDQVPVGRYGKEVLEILALWDDVEAKISYGTNVKEVLSQVSYGAVNCGIVYSTDAIGVEGITVVEQISGDLLTAPIYYPGAVLANSAQSQLATAFLAGLMAQEDLVADWGFTSLSPTIATGEVPQAETTLTIFAAASLTELLSAYGESFAQTYPQIDLVFNFDSSGTLCTQILYGADCDLFLSASTTEVETLVTEGMIDGDDVLYLFENQLVLIIPS